MKRFTDTAKWNDRWFCSLIIRRKLLWIYLVDNCDCAGIIDLNKELVEFLFGQPIDWTDDLEAFNGRLRLLPNGKFWLTKFIDFQYGTLSGDCIPHRKVIESLRKHNLLEEYLKGTCTLQEEDKKKKRKDRKEGECEGKPMSFSRPTEEECRNYAVKLEMPADEGTAFFHYFEGRGWKFKDGSKVVSWRSAMVNWKKNWQAGAFAPKASQNGATGQVSIRTPMDADNVLKSIQSEMERIRDNNSNRVADPASPQGWRLKPDALEQIKKLRMRREEVQKMKVGLK